jgi:hypothetical protein
MAAHWLICGHLGIMCQVENTSEGLNEALNELSMQIENLREVLAKKE